MPTCWGTRFPIPCHPRCIVRRITFLGEQNLGYERRDTLPDDLPAMMHGVRHPDGTEDAPYIAGLSVTMPLKTAVIQYCDEISEMAQVTGAVNTVYPRGEEDSGGHNTDVIGIVNALRHAGLEPEPLKGFCRDCGWGSDRYLLLAMLHALGYRRVSVYAVRCISSVVCRRRRAAWAFS